jgi:ankyrin repeat protein
VIDLLISKGADPNEQDENGSTPFTNALINHNFSIVSKILQVSRPNFNLIDKDDKNIIHQMGLCSL